MNFIPMPERKDYQAAIELTDEQLKRMGGAWFVAYKSELNAHTDPAVHASLSDAVDYARAMEPTNDDGEPLDPMLYRTHAFKHGMMAGNYVSSIAHDEIMTTSGILRGLRYLTDNNSTSAYDRADTIVSIAESGLALVGEAARDRIDAWSDDAVSDVGSRRMYGLGCGAVLFAAHVIHRDYNERSFNEFMSATGWSDE